VKRFLDALAELRRPRRRPLFWILGVDMAHMGARYQDRFECRRRRGRDGERGDRDEQRIARINAMDAEGFWDAGAGAARRFEMVRLVAFLYFPEDRAEGLAESCCATSSGTSTTAAWSASRGWRFGNVHRSASRRGRPEYRRGGDPHRGGRPQYPQRGRRGRGLRALLLQFRSEHHHPAEPSAQRRIQSADRRGLRHAAGHPHGAGLRRRVEDRPQQDRRDGIFGRRGAGGRRGGPL
jgi:hypothetical protein